MRPWSMGEGGKRKEVEEKGEGCEGKDDTIVVTIKRKGETELKKKSDKGTREEPQGSRGCQLREWSAGRTGPALI